MTLDLPNIVICQCDQLRAFNVGCYGDPVVKTPNMDRLAARGVRFETAITPNPVCTPARSAILSGQFSRTCAGMLGNVHKDPPNPNRERLNSQTLPECLKALGYETALIGKWHVDPQPQLIGFDRALYPKVAHRHYGQTVFDEHTNAQVVDEFLEDFFIDRVRSTIETPRDTPFFLHYNISTPHQPIGPGQMPEKYLNMYDPEQIELRPNTRTEGETPHDPQFWYRVYRSADFFWDWLAKREPRPEDAELPEGFGLKDLTALYYGAISCVDDYLGKLLDILEANGTLDNTIIVFCADHGDNLGSHGLFNKNSLIEEAIRVPLIMAGPGLTFGVQPNPVNLVDVAPTLLSLLGQTPPAHMQGEAVDDLPQTIDPERATFIETGRQIAIRTQTHLYGLPFDESKRCVTDGNAVFYDLQTDPYELHNLADTDEQAELRASLHDRLLAWDMGCPWMATDQNPRQAEA